MEPVNQAIESLIAQFEVLKVKVARKISLKQDDKPWHRSKLKTGLVYDDFMDKHKCIWTKSDECPKRYHAVKSRLEHYSLIQQCHVLGPEMASEDMVLLAHEKEYYEIVKSTKGMKDDEQLKRLSEKYDGIYFNEFTYDCAMLALGSCIKLTDKVLDQDELRNGFAVVRTPGHHAQAAEANGFCFFNNAAIVAKHSIKNRGLSRVLIIDWDVHHGQGTQSFFYDDPNILYVSIHRYEKGKYWPELIESNFNFTGQGKGKGFNINLPLNEIDCNDADFLLMWFNVIMPVAYEFNPELVLISAGFDAAIGCPEGKMRVKPLTYHVLCHSLMSLADGKVVALLEGGYNLTSLGESAALTLRCLLGYPCPRLDASFMEMKPHKSVVETILSSIWALRPHWRMLHMQGYFERFESEDSNIAPSAGGDNESRPKHCPVATYEGPMSAFSDKKPEKYDLAGVCCPKDETRQARINEELQQIIARTDLTTPELAFEKRTLLMFDDDMIRHKCHESHPEKPARYSSIKKRLEESGLLDRCTLGKSRRATEAEVAKTHDTKLIELLRKTQQMSKNKLIELGNSMDSIYINQFTFDCALLAAGCCLEAVDRVLSRQNSNAFCLIRPPGHHAGHDEASGFCFFNNVVVAANYALEKFPEVCKRILILDYDFHHGNGVQELVQEREHLQDYDNNAIMYVSLHGYDDARQYPNDIISNYTTGSKYIINIPWNDDVMGDTEYIAAYLSIVLPCAYEFNPDLVLVSSGFDAAIKDPLGRYKLSPAAYGHLVHHLLPLAGGKLIACLEGGYNLESISEASANVVSVLLGDPPQSLNLRMPPSISAQITLKNVLAYQKSHFPNMLCLDYDLPSDEPVD